MARKYEGVRKLPSGRYQARYTHPHTKRAVTIGGTFASAVDARDARNLELAKLNNGGWVDPTHAKMTVEQWSAVWITARPSTNRTLLSHLNARILPVWGATRLKDVTALGLQHWVNDLAEEGLAPATVHDLYSTFSLMMAAAVTYGKLAQTPCQPRAVRLAPIPKTEPVQLSAETMRLLEAQAPPRFKAMIHLGCWAGLRLGELIGLRWSDVDLEADLGVGIIHVQHALKHDGSWGLPKNDKKRKVPVGPETVAVLREHRRDFGNGTMDLLFTTQRQNRPLGVSNWHRNVWGPLVVKCELDPKPTPHDMRHAHAAHLVAQGLDWQVVADRLGHHHPSFTMDRYGYARPDAHEVTLAALERAMA